MQSKKNFLIITPIFPPEIGGPARYVSELATRLSDKYRVKIISFGKNNQQTESLISIGLASSSLKRQLSLFKALSRCIPSAEIVYVQGGITVGVVSSVVSLMFRKPYWVKWVGDEGWEQYQQQGGKEDLVQYLIQASTQSLGWKAWGIYRLQRWVLNHAKAVITPGQFLQNILKTFYHIQAVDIPNAIEVSDAHPTLKKKKHRLLFVGRLMAWKHVDQLIQAMAILTQQSKDPWKLSIVGSGPEEKSLKLLVKKHKLEKQVQFLGSMPKTKVIESLWEAEYLVLYSGYEGLSHTILEAMATKTKIVASDIPANRDLLVDGKWGKLVPLYQPQAITDALLAPYSQQQVEAAYTWVNHHYTWEGHLKKLKRLFEKL